MNIHPYSDYSNLNSFMQDHTSVGLHDDLASSEHGNFQDICFAETLL